MQMFLCWRALRGGLEESLPQLVFADPGLLASKLDERLSESVAFGSVGRQPFVQNLESRLRGKVLHSSCLTTDSRWWTEGRMMMDRKR
jgi:hypothetical protein